MVKLLPVSFGAQLSMIAPCGKAMKAKRFGVLPAAVCAIAVAAGTMDSRSGSAMVAPIPCRTVRREICFLDMNMSSPYSYWLRPIGLAFAAAHHSYWLRPIGLAFAAAHHSYWLRIIGLAFAAAHHLLAL